MLLNLIFDFDVGCLESRGWQIRLKFGSFLIRSEMGGTDDAHLPASFINFIFYQVETLSNNM
jgi:hypothetical protein